MYTSLQLSKRPRRHERDLLDLLVRIHWRVPVSDRQNADACRVPSFQGHGELSGRES